MMHVLSAAFYDAEWARFSSSLWPLAWHGSLKWWHGWFRPIEFPFPCHCKFCWISPTCCKASSFSLSLVWNVKAKVHVAGAHSNTDTLRGPTAPVPLLDPLLQPEAFNFEREIIPAWAQIPPEEIIVGLFPANFPLLNNVTSSFWKIKRYWRSCAYFDELCNYSKLAFKSSWKYSVELNCFSAIWREERIQTV